MPTPSNPTPTSLSHVIGQANAVKRLQVALECSFADQQPFPHTLLCGGPGLGMTSLAHIIAAEMASDCFEALGQSFQAVSTLNGFLLRAEKDNSIVFIDEVHELPDACQTALYRAMEGGVVFLHDSRSDRVTKLPLARVSVIAATTDPQHLLAPLRDRFKLTCTLEAYGNDELVAILKQRLRALDWQYAAEILPAIAQRSFGTVRTAIRLLEAVHRTARSEGSTALLLEHLNATLALERIDHRGLSLDEQAYLRLLATVGGPVRLGTIAARLRLPTTTVSQVMEPRLLHLDLIERHPQGRTLTAKGHAHTQLLKETRNLSHA